MLFNRSYLLVKTIFNVNGSYNDHPAKTGILHEEESIEYMINFCSNNLMSRHINCKMQFAQIHLFSLPYLRVLHSLSSYTFRPMTSITTLTTAPKLGKRYLIFTVFKHLLMKMYVRDFSGTFINVKIELRKPYNSRSGSLKISFTISAVSISVSENINPHPR